MRDVVNRVVENNIPENSSPVKEVPTERTIDDEEAMRVFSFFIDFFMDFFIDLSFLEKNNLIAKNHNFIIILQEN